MADVVQPATPEDSLDEVIKNFRIEREKERAAKKLLAEAAIAQAELNKTNAATAQKIADANLDAAKAETISSKAKLNEASEKSKIEDQQIKNERKKLDQEKTRKVIDDSHVETLEDDLESLRKKSKRMTLEEREFKELANKLGEVRELIKSPITKLYDLASKHGFDVVKRPLSTAVGLTGFAANSIVNQDKVPPIFGILVKALTAGGIFTAGIIEKGIGRLGNALLKRHPEAKELAKSDPILKEIYAINKKLAIELANLRISKFKSDLIEKGTREKELLIRERSEKSQRHSSETIFKSVNETSNKVSKLESEDKIITNIPKEEIETPDVILKKEPDLFKERVDANLIDKIDDIIVLVKSISNQFDPEVDTERYNEEVTWRKEVLDRLDLLKTGKPVETSKSAFGFLEGGALASIATFVGGVFTSVSKFLLPLGLLSKGLLKFATPLGLVASMIMTLNWDKDIVDPIKRIKSTFADGRFVEAIFKAITLPSDIVTKFVTRSIASVAGIFGFEDVEKEINLLADNVSFVDSIIKLKDILLGYFNEITNGIDFNFAGVKDSVLANLNSIRDTFAGLNIDAKLNDIAESINTSIDNLNIGKSINDLFDFVSDKIESLKFWKNDKVFKTPEFLQRIMPETFKKDTTSEIVNKNVISNTNSIDKIENNISKLDTNKTISNLTKSHEKLIEKQSIKEKSSVEKLSQQLGNITTNVVNQQVNNSNITSIASRPRARIEEKYSHTNHSSDFSGYQIS